jgi:hypothetical protein
MYLHYKINLNECSWLYHLALHRWSNIYIAQPIEASIRSGFGWYNVNALFIDAGEFFQSMAQGYEFKNYTEIFRISLRLESAKLDDYKSCISSILSFDTPDDLDLKSFVNQNNSIFILQHKTLELYDIAETKIESACIIDTGLLFSNPNATLLIMADEMPMCIKATTNNDLIQKVLRECFSIELIAA